MSEDRYTPEDERFDGLGGAISSASENICDALDRLTEAFPPPERTVFVLFAPVPQPLRCYSMRDAETFWPGMPATARRAVARAMQQRWATVEFWPDTDEAPSPSVRHERGGETIFFEPLPSLCECGSNTWVFTHISTGPNAKACARCAKCGKSIELAQQTGERP